MAFSLTVDATRRERITLVRKKKNGNEGKGKRRKSFFEKKEKKEGTKELRVTRNKLETEQICASR